MDFGSKIAESKEYTSNILRENYNSNNSSKFSAPSQIVEEIRKKYDTPTRREAKQYTSRPNYDKQSINMEPEAKKSVNSTQGPSVRDRWTGQLQTRNYEPSPSYTKENIAGQQQTIFRKIKEMKDSLLNKNQKIKTTKSIYEPRASEKLQARMPMLNDNRVENIDKINIKIQQILSCLKQTENKNAAVDSQLKMESKPPMSKPYEASNRGLQNYSRANERQTRSYHYNQQNRQNLETKMETKIETKMEVKNTSSIYQEDKKYKIASPAPKNVQNFQLSSNRGENSKVRSFINSIQKQTGAIAGSKYEMRSGKKLDDQISKIQSKIHQFEEEKRRLNIDFKPYSYSNSKSTIDLSKRSYTLDKNQRPLSKFEAVKPAQNQRKVEQFSYGSRTQKAGGYEKFLQKSTQERYSARMSYDPSIKEKKVEIVREQNIEAASINVEISKRDVSQQNPLFKIKLIPVDEQKSSSSSRIQTRLLSEDVRRKADQGIQDRKKRLISDQPSKLRPTIKKLVDKLSEQTKLDQKLRNDKLYFESNLENKKWETLAEVLSKKGIRLSIDKMQKIFKITDQQNNPFFSVRQSQSSLDMLATSYAASQDHWNRQIYKKFNKEDLKNQDFTMNTLDLEKKGYIVLEDIVRFLNMQTGTFYRNRDLFLIFRKISEQQKITFDELMNAICK